MSGILIVFLFAHVGNARFDFCDVAFDTKLCPANAVRHRHSLSDVANIDFEIAAIGFKNACEFTTMGFQNAFGIPECIRICDTWIPDSIFNLQQMASRMLSLLWGLRSGLPHWL